MAILSADKLDIYNRALPKLGSRLLASLSEGRESRRILDGHWGASDNLVLYALERADWTFATRIVELSYSPSVEPSFGHRKAFDVPTDLRKLTSLSANEMFSIPLVASDYEQTATYWLCDLETLFVKYVSDDASYGFNSSRWSEHFKEYLAARLAWLSCERLTNSGTKRRELFAEMKMNLAAANSLDSMAEGVKFPPRGGWALSRGSYLSRGRQ